MELTDCMLETRSIAAYLSVSGRDGRKMRGRGAVMNTRKKEGADKTGVTAKFIGHLDGRVWAESYAAAVSSMFPGLRAAVRSVRPNRLGSVKEIRHDDI